MFGSNPMLCLLPYNLQGIYHADTLRHSQHQISEKVAARSHFSIARTLPRNKSFVLGGTRTGGDTFCHIRATFCVKCDIFCPSTW